MASDPVRNLFLYRWLRRLYRHFYPAPSELDVALEGIHDVVCVFDIGANVGDLSIYFLKKFGEATVYAFEPISSTFETLNRNVAKSSFAQRFRPYKLGFFSEAKEEMINITTFHGANSLLPISDDYRRDNPHIQVIGQEPVQLVTMDNFVQENGIKRIDIVKIDVEGVERDVILGGRKTFQEIVDTVILEMSLVRKGIRSDEFIKILQLLHDLGFSLSAIIGIAQGGGHISQMDCVFRKMYKMPASGMNTT